MGDKEKKLSLFQDIYAMNGSDGDASNGSFAPSDRSNSGSECDGASNGASVPPAPAPKPAPPPPPPAAPQHAEQREKTNMRKKWGPECEIAAAGHEKEISLKEWVKISGIPTGVSGQTRELTVKVGGFYSVAWKVRKDDSPCCCGIFVVEKLADDKIAKASTMVVRKCWPLRDDVDGLEEHHQRMCAESDRPLLCRTDRQFLMKLQLAAGMKEVAVVAAGEPLVEAAEFRFDPALFVFEMPTGSHRLVTPKVVPPGKSMESYLAEMHFTTSGDKVLLRDERKPEPGKKPLNDFLRPGRDCYIEPKPRFPPKRVPKAPKKRKEEPNKKKSLPSKKKRKEESKKSKKSKKPARSDTTSEEEVEKSATSDDDDDDNEKFLRGAMRSLRQVVAAVPAERLPSQQERETIYAAALSFATVGTK